jgi:hypothetical protein
MEEKEIKTKKIYKGLLFNKVKNNLFIFLSVLGSYILFNLFSLYSGKKILNRGFSYVDYKNEVEK